MPSRDWAALARATAPDLPDEQVARIAPVLDALEAQFRPVADGLPFAAEPAIVFACGKDGQ